MNKDVLIMSKILVFFLVFIGIVYFLNYIPLTGELIFKLGFFTFAIAIGILLIRFAWSFEIPKKMPNIKTVNYRESEIVKESIQVNSLKSENVKIDSKKIVQVVTNFLNSNHRYLFLDTDRIATESICYNIFKNTGLQLGIDQIVPILIESGKYEKRSNRIINIDEEEKNSKDFHRLQEKQEKERNYA